MSHGLETLEQQSAPESTRGLFDVYPDKKVQTGILQSSTSTDRHRSLDSSGRPSRQSFQSPASRNNNNNNNNNSKAHQRSRSASASDMGYFGTRRNHSGLQTLTEEGGHQEQENHINNFSKSRRTSTTTTTTTTTTISGRRESVTMDSLKDMINSLKAIPPTTSVSTSSLSTSATNGTGRRYGHRKQQSMSSLSSGQQQSQHSNIRRSYNDGNKTSDMHSVLQNTVQELRSIPFSSSDKVTAPRPSSSSSYRRFGNHSSNSNSGSDDDMVARDDALAEAEAKLMGSFMTTGISNNKHHSSITRRRSSDSSTDLPLTLHKRTSLQQLATLSEETGPLTDRLTASRSFSALSKRTQFNKPLDLYSTDEGSKRKSLGHSRRSSRNVDMDWRLPAPSQPIAQPTSPRQSFQLVPFTPTRVNFARDDANPHQRRPLFIAHLPFSALTPLFRTRQLVRGMLRVNKRNRSDAYVFCEELDADIYICGSRDRNRALEGDVVAVRLVDVDKVLQEKREKEQIKMSRNASRVRLPDEEDENEIIFGGDEEVEVIKPKYCGVVVAIMERAQNQVFSGTLTLIRPNNKRAQEEDEKKNQQGADSASFKKDTPRIVWFKATDKRVPLIAIPIEQAPDDFVENSQKYATRLFVGSIKRWPITSLHPFGTLEKELGSVYELSTQTKAIYADNNITDTDFSEAVYNCLPPGDFEASVDNNTSTTNKRRDFTGVRCFTIDPKGSNVLDDALSIEKLEDGSYQVGVHISDVSYFIKPHSALDKEARTRGVRVDLLHSHVPMVPEVMTEKLTNLIPNHTRFAFSVVWKMTMQGKVLDTWYGKSTIRSCAQLTIEDAQHVVKGGSLDNNNGVISEKYRQDIENDIRLLNTLATELYNLRSQTGILTLLRDELTYDFDPEFTPLNVSVLTKPIQTHRIIKEFLLLANTSVAQRISSRLPEQALLRRHATPVDRKIRALQQFCSRQLGVQVDIGSAGHLEKSVQAIADPKLRKLVSVIVLKTLHVPKYFCAGTYDIAKYSHYALNVPLFTHFTAPSRRFADILVHRQLEYALSSEDAPFYLDRDTVQKLTQHCNVKKEAAHYAREQSSLLFLGVHLNKLAKQNGKSVVYREATVVAVCEGHLDVMVPELNMEKRVHLANLPVWRSDYNENKQTLTMYWRKGVDTSTGKQRHWSILDDDDDDDDSDYLDEELLLEEMLQTGALTKDDDDEEEEEEEKVSSSLILDRNDNVSCLQHNDQQQSVLRDLEDNKEQTVIGLSILEQHARKAMPVDTPDISPTVTSSTKKLRPESTQSTSAKRASLVRARLSDSTAYSTEQGYQTIKALDKIRVALVIDMVRTPPLIRILAVNPFA
ncbi:uncharacterized protein BX664DRAFT_354405 [Halteromyces radiatus]|uniref:uncharacterized protein n=1 Tax=Halteromyces radiatus TaxID=101107 RepID=UPI00221F0488|nr:uncharacterized protein BX664DRAFT_354405 [Halteromyces radiatus]KAI8098895.1 hypothetical protein BX664DRAFT_354405 [Halteromyces radiatus]